ncbi:MAG: dihydropteroate synthase [Planktomarina sp.]|nr:dihydropteroate synthase [Planktomarina sp.]
MTFYYRPLIEEQGTNVLSGGWCRFSRVEALSRHRQAEFISADEVPQDILHRLTSVRSNLGANESDRPQVMGILNTTPDSFSDGGQFDSSATARARAVRLMQEGADIIDIGGESTRPGADLIAVDEEMSRTKPVILDVRQASSLPLSIDTRKAPVAAAALDAGIDWINDVSALTFDSEMARLAARSGAPVCLMHAPSDPKTMQQNAQYEDVLLDVYDYLAKRVDFALSQGILRHNIIVDPGIGFGKTLEHNLALLRGLAVFHGLGCPILLGASRKRFIGTISGVEKAQDCMAGSVAVALAAAGQGAQILRVHDVRETVQALKLWAAVRG